MTSLHSPCSLYNNPLCVITNACTYLGDLHSTVFAGPVCCMLVCVILRLFSNSNRAERLCIHLSRLLLAWPVWTYLRVRSRSDHLKRVDYFSTRFALRSAWRLVLWQLFARARFTACNNSALPLDSVYSKVVSSLRFGMPWYGLLFRLGILLIPLRCLNGQNTIQASSIRFELALSVKLCDQQLPASTQYSCKPHPIPGRRTY